ncbi:MAG: NAD-dependent deacylase, partial [Sphingobacteriaceae bacterium]
ALVKLEEKYNVQIITQNVDDLHERAGSANVMHLHGVITKSQSDVDATLTYPINGWELQETDLCEHGKPLRPHVVWFGEDVPMMYEASKLCRQADIFAVIGTSLQVYPAAGLTSYVSRSATKYVIDPKAPAFDKGVISISKTATQGVPEWVSQLLGGD